MQLCFVLSTQIPNWNFLDTINDDIQTAIAATVSALRNIITAYQQNEKQCKNERFQFECDALVLGALIKGCLPLQIWPPSVAPPTKVSVQQLHQDIRQMRIPAYCKRVYHDDRSSHETQGCSGLEDVLGYVLCDIENDLNGLTLGIFRL